MVALRRDAGVLFVGTSIASPSDVQLYSADSVLAYVSPAFSCSSWAFKIVSAAVGFV